MKVNELFLRAKKDKHLRSMLVIDRIEKNDENIEERKKYIRLCIDIRSKYKTVISPETEFVETPTEIRYEDYSGQSIIKNSKSLSAVFHMSIYLDSHILTFLKSIRKDSDVSFKIVAFNSCESWNTANFVHHSLYGIINDNYYLLQEYTGFDNLASPIHY